MVTNQIEYCVAGSRHNGWTVLRQNRQLAHRRDMFDAVALATHIAEREARSSSSAVKVMLAGKHQFTEAAPCLGNRLPTTVQGRMPVSLR
jgi:hypothetical protein